MSFVDRGNGRYIVSIAVNSSTNIDVSGDTDYARILGVDANSFLTTTGAGNSAGIDSDVKFDAADGDSTDALEAFLNEVGDTTAGSGQVLRTFAIDSNTVKDDRFATTLQMILRRPDPGVSGTLGGTVNDVATSSLSLQLLEALQIESKTAVFDLNAMSELSAGPADAYALALENLRSLGEGTTIGIAELTQRTTDVQVESGKLEMINGVIKNAVNYLNGRARALTS